jgi:hypothetical protein
MRRNCVAAVAALALAGVVASGATHAQYMNETERAVWYEC